MTEWTLTFGPPDLRNIDLDDLLGAEAGEPSKAGRASEMLSLGKTPEGVQTLLDARGHVEKRLEEGVSCPCCGQWAQIHRWGIKPKQAVGLLLLAWFAKENPEHGNRFVHVTRFFAALGLPPRISTLLPTDFPKLRHWGLLEEGDRGFYRLTKLGLDFVAGQKTVQEAILTYNDSFLGTVGDPVSIYDALGDIFDLRAFEYENYLAMIETTTDLDMLVDLESRVRSHPKSDELLKACYRQLDEITMPMAA